MNEGLRTKFSTMYGYLYRANSATLASLGMSTANPDEAIEDEGQTQWMCEQLEKDQLQPKADSFHGGMVWMETMHALQCS
jgi:hypothetical protein